MEATIRRCRPAFTLIEAMTVVAIVSILAGVLVPALTHAHARGQAVVCASNLGQCFTGILLYTEEHGGRLPYMGSYDASRRVAHPQTDHGWPIDVAPYLDDEWEVFRCPSDPTPVVVAITEDEVVPLDGQTAAIDLPSDVEQIARLSYRGEERRRSRIIEPARPMDAVLLTEGLTRPIEANDHFHDIMPPSPASRRRSPRGQSPVLDASFRRHSGGSHFLFYSGAIEAVDDSSVPSIQQRHLASGLRSLFLPQ